MYVSTFVFYLTLIAVRAEAFDPAYQIYALSGSTPNIDGLITIAEWSDASTVTFNNTLVYVKYDGKNLYFSFNISDSTFDLTDAVGVFIDTQNDGGDSFGDDDYLLIIWRNGTKLECHDQPPATAPIGWDGATTSTGSGWQAEINVTYSKISIISGEAKTLGIAFTSNYYSWPPLPVTQQNIPSNWGNLLSEENWIPEFPFFLILSIFMLASLLIVLSYRIYTKKKRRVEMAI